MLFFDRDLGQHIRDQVKIAFVNGEVFPGNQQKCDLEYLALKRISESQHAKQYPRKLKSSALGLSLEECSSLVSNDFLKTVEEEEQGIFKRTLNKVFKSKDSK